VERPPAVGAAWLLGHCDEVRIADVRWTLGAPGKGRSSYDEGHLPGAVFLDVDADLSDLSRPGPGRHPLPRPERFAEAMGRAGIGDETRVVAYDDAGGAIAARLWWLLGRHGHARAHILDGGIGAWVAGGGRLTRHVPRPEPARFTVRPPLLVVVDRAHVAGALGRALLLDARAPERYEGRVESIDPRAGHVPRARSAPWTGNLDAAGRVLPSGDLRARYQALGAIPGREVICYCGSGVTACLDVLALFAAGLDPPALYEGAPDRGGAGSGLAALQCSAFPQAVALGRQDELQRRQQR
jgi:thiosulfate/3-mercaptopyruvate sulfurtransferase